MKGIAKRAATIFLALAVIFAFTPLTGAENVYGAEVPVNIDTPDGMHFSNDTIMASVYCHGQEVFFVGYDGEATDLVIPSTVQYGGKTYTVVGIEEESLLPADDEYYAYWLDHDLDSLVLPDTLEYIISHSIALGITELTIPESVTMIEEHAISCPNLKTIRVLSTRTGGQDLYMDQCMGYHWDEASDDYVINDDLVVWGVNTGEWTIDESAIQDWCQSSGVTFKGFPPGNPRWDSNVAVWDPPAYRADAVDYYELHVYKNGKMMTNNPKTINADDPTACRYDFSVAFRDWGRGTYKFYVTAVCNGYGSERTAESAEYVYNGPVNQRTITFDANGGSGDMPPVTIDAGEPYTVPACTFTPPAGKDFLGWKIDGTEYGVGQIIPSLNRSTKAIAQWKDPDEPGWTFSIAVPDVVLGPAHVGYTNNTSLSEGLIVYNTGTRRIAGVNLEIEVTDDKDDAFLFQNGKPGYPAVNNSTSGGYFRPKLGLAPGTYTCKVTVTPPPPAEPVTANVSFTVTDHTWGNTWQSDSDSHWKKCTECTATSEKVPHDTDGSVTGRVDATFDTDGYTGDKHCSVCGAVSEKGEDIPAGKWILESGATSDPTYLKAGMSYGQMTLTPEHQGKYTVRIINAWDVTGGGSLVPANRISSTDTFEAGHDYTFELRFDALGDYEYYDNGDMRHRWSKFTFNGAPTRTAVMFDSATLRYVDLHCFGTYKPSIADTVISVPDQTYTGNPIKPALTVTYTDSSNQVHTLVKGVDYYVLDYMDNTEVGEATVIIKPVVNGAFSGSSKTGMFRIVPRNLYEGTAGSTETVTYSGAGFKPEPVVTWGGETLTKGVDYDITYRDSGGNEVTAPTDAGWYTIIIYGIGNYTDVLNTLFVIEPADISGAEVSGIAAQTYTGQALTPAFTPQYNGRNLVEGTDYTAVYSKNTDIGTATITITGQGNFTGTKTITFNIQEAKTGWVKEDGCWYYYNASGVKTTGWQKVGGVWYYMDSAGVMQTGWQKVGGVWYYMNSAGVMQTGWEKIGGRWYYFNSSGAMQTGWQKISGSWYYFNSSGSMGYSEWRDGYWLNANGTWTYQPRGSWKKSGGRWWFGDTSGWYAKNTTIWIDGSKYSFDASGWLK